MADIYFEDLVHSFPNQISSEMLKHYEAVGEAGIQIDQTALFHITTEVGLVQKIGANCVIGAFVVLKDGVYLGNSARIDSGSVLEEGVSIAGDFSVGRNSYFAERSKVPPLTETARHTYLRQIEEGCVIGPDVVLPDEVQLGDAAVIPTTKSIAQIGRFGGTQRMVTVYGSWEEPLYSVGCQYGITAEAFRERVRTNEGTDETSAADYAKHMTEIEAVGLKVQKEFTRQEDLINELLHQRNEAASVGLRSH